MFRKNEKKFQRIYRQFARVRTPYEDLVLEKKRLIIGKYMAGDVDRLAQLMKSISAHDRYGSDITLYGLKRALVEVLALFRYIAPTSATNFLANLTAQ